MTPRRIGVLGGTFDPVHTGHVVAAVEARHRARLDAVLLVVANVPWQKSGTRDVTPAEDRYAMVDAAVAWVEGVEASRLEIDRGGESYTADTIDQLATAEPGVELFVIVGTDVAAQVHTWVRIDELRRRAGLVVVTRQGVDGGVGLSGWAHGIEVVEIPDLAISGTDIRSRVAEGRPIDGLVPPAAVRLIPANAVCTLALDDADRTPDIPGGRRCDAGKAHGCSQHNHRIHLRPASAHTRRQPGPEAAGDAPEPAPPGRDRPAPRRGAGGRRRLPPP